MALFDTFRNRFGKGKQIDGIVKFLLNDFLTKPVILIGLLICGGYIMKREGAMKVITGTVSMMVGIQMVKGRI